MTFCEDAVFWDTLNEAEDVVERRLLVSCDPNRQSWNTVMGPLRDPNPHGSLWVYSPDAGARPSRITLQGYPEAHDFHPLGLDIWPTGEGGGPSNLFVVNHARARTVIEQFTMYPSTPTTATWVRTLTHRAFVAPNALALTSPTSFYVSNDHLMTRRLPGPLGRVLPLVETLLALPLGWLAHVSLDADAPADTNTNTNTTTPPAPTLTHTIVAAGIPFANGVALSPDGRLLALASTTLQHVALFSRDPTTHALSRTHTIPLPFSVDNIRFDDDGVLLVAGHPHFPSLVRVAANASSVAPSWVMAVSQRAPPLVTLPKAYDVHAPVSASARAPTVPSHDAETLFQSEGSVFSTSSTGLRDARTGTLYVTGLYEDGLLICRP
jgi:hypothetical protein